MFIDQHNKNIGILGFGVVGKSALKFFKDNKFNNISTWDSRDLNLEEQALIKNYKACFFNSAQISVKDFLEQNDLILISPGIDLTKLIKDFNFDNYKNKLICELDIFSEQFLKKSIAITGTLGKTSITNILNSLLNKLNIKSVIGGNIGYGMLDILKQQNSFDTVVLELSSFQLELNKKFSPDIAIWTNFYPNHLDRHKNLKEYFDAKANIFKYQKEGQSLIISQDILAQDPEKLNILSNLKSSVYIIGEGENPDPSIHFLLLQKTLRASGIFYVYVKNNILYLNNYQGELNNTTIFDLSLLPDLSYKSNWYFILTALYILKKDLNLLSEIFKQNENILDIKEEKEQEHRLELFYTKNNIDFYNDSKSTVIQATEQALKKLDENNRPIILILGGLSKGVDRSPLISYLSNIKNLKKVFCLGNSADFEYFDQYSSLESLISAIMQIAKDNDQILFSPSGSSFDLFKDYKERGIAFKKAVLEYVNGTGEKG